MLQKHEKELLNVMMPLGQAIDSLSNLEKGVHSGNLDVDSAEVYNAINEAKELLDKSVKAIHDIEDRKQEEVLKNVNLDKLFEGHPVNAYVQAILGFLPSDDFKPGINMVDLISNFNKACLELAKHQQETEEALQKATAPKPKTEEEFVHYVTDSLDLAHPDLADTYKDALRLGIEQLKRHGHGVAPFVIPLKSGAAYGKLRVNKGVIEIKLNDLNFLFDPNAVEEEVAAEPAPVAEGQVIACECTENCTTYCIKNISKEEYMREVMEAHLTPCTCDDKSDCSTPCERDVLLDLAIAQLTDKKTFTGSDYGLIRYFLSVVEKADEKELEGLSNRALELAWNRYWYLRNEK
ncbi:hypothetical protein BC01_021 [Bacillus phage BC01]|nr:hypothetical protein PBC6_019 [Bacillus phage PBC6]AXU41118.1 hypothetical protein BC01_021 [Bacillus phage BC01]